MKLIRHRHREGGLALELDDAAFGLERLVADAVPGEWRPGMMRSPRGLFEESGALERLAGSVPRLRDFLEAHPDHDARLPGRIRCGRIEGLDVGPPLPRPGKILCAGMNYREHALELDLPIPDRPHVFSKLPSSVTGPYDEIVIPEGLAREIDYEVELAMVIGRPCRACDLADARRAIAAYVVVNDVSARDWQFAEDSQLMLGKGFDSFLPMGPRLVTADEIDDPNALSVRCEVNGDERQASTTAELIAGVDELIVFLSQGVTLMPGDVVCTGTPSGVGVGLQPPTFLRPGDLVNCTVEGVGTLSNRVVSSEGA